MLAKAGIVTICVFRSTPQNVKSYASHATLALSDKKGSVYETYRLKSKGLGGGLFGLAGHIFSNIRKYGKYIRPIGSVKDVMNGDMKKVSQMPADFMIDEEGRIVDLFRAEKYSDQVTFDRVEAFIPEDKRCTCKKGECISPRCREEYRKIKENAATFLYTG
mmetsp:Transcript_44605/g.82735  ORF Transcript_44605/g.82735 Transcript_44605/m.82735 type:complete len:162 (-) Transcript_44605:379-864(-)